MIIIKDINDNNNNDNDNDNGNNDNGSNVIKVIVMSK